MSDNKIICTFCGKDYFKRGLGTHKKYCKINYDDALISDEDKQNGLGELCKCRFCNILCSRDYVFIHEQVCDNKIEFSPFTSQQHIDNYKNILNYDSSDKLSRSNCRHCYKSILSTGIFKHESSCRKQLDRLIGPIPEQKRCKICSRYYFIDKYTKYTYFDGRPVGEIYKTFVEHYNKCKLKLIPLDMNRPIIKCSKVKTKITSEYINDFATKYFTKLKQDREQSCELIESK